VATVTANGVVVGVAAGRTTVYATLGELKDSATVVVRSSPDTLITTPATPTPVASFALTALVYGPGAPATPGDTATIVTFAGATVSVYRLSANPAVPADTLGVRTLVQSATTNANGEVVFTNLASDNYVVTAEGASDGASGGATLSAHSYFGPPSVSALQIGLVLHR
jgi:hypothetical protein